MKTYATTVKIEDKKDVFSVNGVDVPKDFLKTLFAFVGAPDTEDTRYDKLIAYLCLVPFLHDEQDHFTRFHGNISPAAKQALHLAGPVYRAIGLSEQTAHGFMKACMSQIDIEFEHVGRMTEYIFGDCDKETFTYEGNVIPFASKTVN
jgi:hypothetical protein